MHRRMSERFIEGMTGTDTDALDAGLLAAADAVMDSQAGRNVGFTTQWRKWQRAVSFRDVLLAALRSERVRGEESMRDRAAALAHREAAEIGEGALADTIRDAICALPTTDQETTHG